MSCIFVAFAMFFPPADAPDRANSADQIIRGAKVPGQVDFAKYSREVDDRIVSFQLKSRYGLRNRETGEVVAPAVFDERIEFPESGPPFFYVSQIARVCRGGRWGFILSDGRMLIRPVFERADGFTVSGLAKVQVQGKWGFVDTSGTFVIAPRYRRARCFTEGLAAVTNDRENWGFIHRDSTWAIAPTFETVQFFYEGRAAVSVNGKYGFIDKLGRTVIKPLYDRVYHYRSGRIDVVRGQEIGVIDLNGTIILPFRPFRD